MATQPIETQELEKQSTSLTVQAHRVQSITDARHFTQIFDLGEALKAMDAGIETYWGPLCKAAYDQHKALVKRRDDMRAPVQIALSHLTYMLKKWERDQREKKQQEERIAQEAQRKIDDAAALVEAQRLQASGDRLGAEAVLTQQANAPAPAVVLPSNIPNVGKKFYRSEVWRWRYKDPSQVKPEYLAPDTRAIDSAVRHLKKKAETAVGGIEVYSE